jgi:hypothetical protein
MSTRGRGVVRLWVKTCSDYDDRDQPTEVLYQTVYDGKVFEIRATSEEVVFFVSPRHQVRAEAPAVLEAITGQAPAGADGLTALEEALDRHILDVGKPESVTRFGALTSRFELRAGRSWRHESPAPGGSGASGTPPAPDSGPGGSGSSGA